jgi:hypothetical protein
MLYQHLLVDTPSFVLTFNETKQWLHAVWKGPHDAASIVAGCAAMQQCLRKNPCHKVLDDSSLSENDWDEVADWVGQHFFETMARQGVRYFAWVCPSDLVSRKSMELALQQATQPIVAMFNDVATARAWLQAHE